MCRISSIARIFLLLLLSQILLTAGCATSSQRMLEKSDQSVHQQSLFSKVSKKIDEVEQRMAEAQANHIEKFSPDDMGVALDALGEARQHYNQYRFSPEKINKKVALFFGDNLGEKTLSLLTTASQALKRAEDNKRRSDAMLAGSVENFSWLKKFQAQTYFSSAYRDLERSHLGLIRYISKRNFSRAQEKLPQLLREQKALEILAAQRFYLNDISKRLVREGRFTLDRYAALSYGSSLGALNHAKAVIAKNPRKEKPILAARDEVIFSFEIAHAVSKEMQKLVEMDRREMERWLLMVTKKLNETGAALGSKDVRDRSVISQLEAISKAIKQKDKLTKAVGAEKESVTATDDEVLLEGEAQQHAVVSEVEVDSLVNVDTDAVLLENAYVPLSKRRSLFY